MTHYFTVLHGSALRTHCLHSFSLGFIFVHCRYRSGVKNNLMSHNEQSTDVGMMPVVPYFDHPVSIAETLHNKCFLTWKGCCEVYSSIDASSILSCEEWTCRPIASCGLSCLLYPPLSLLVTKASFRCECVKVLQKYCRHSYSGVNWIVLNRRKIRHCRVALTIQTSSQASWPLTFYDTDLQMTLSRGWPWPLLCHNDWPNFLLRYMWVEVALFIFYVSSCMRVVHAPCFIAIRSIHVHVCVVLDLIVCQCIRVRITVDCHSSTLHLINALDQRAVTAQFAIKTHL